MTDANLLLGYLDAEAPLAGGVSPRRRRRGRALGELAGELGLTPRDGGGHRARCRPGDAARAASRDGRARNRPARLRARRLRRSRADARGPPRRAAGDRRVLFPRAAGVLSALGLVVSDRRRDVARSVLLAGRSYAAGSAPPRARARRSAARRACRARGSRSASTSATAGQSFELSVPRRRTPAPAELRELFERAHEERYGYRDPDAELELVNVRCGAIEVRAGRRAGAAGGGDWSAARARAPVRRQALETAVLRARRCRARARGPGGLRAAGGDGRRAARLARHRRRGRHAGPGARRERHRRRHAPGARRRLRAVCEEMGAVLVRSAHSANIKERRDASTALFDGGGEMVMQAEHIPVHLGSMPEAVAAVLGEDHRPGRRLDPQRPLPRRNPPARHHAVSPLFVVGGHVGFAASRAHHADVGGTSRAACPPTRRRSSRRAS